MRWILGRAAVQGRCGAALSSIGVADLDFVDDVAILSKSLVVTLDAFSNEAGPLGLVFWIKTKIRNLWACWENLFSQSLLAGRY